MGNVATRSVVDRTSLAPARPRVVWLAVAEGRGHLMRANLAASLLAPEAIAVDIVTTSDAGVAFCAEFGNRATKLSDTFHVAYNERQNLSRYRTQMHSARYLISPRRCLRDMLWLEGFTSGASLVVNDSLHPVLLAASLAGMRYAPRIVHVHGANVRRTVEEAARRGPMLAMFRGALARGTQIEIGEQISESEPGVYRLPPLLPTPRPAGVVRAELGVPVGARLAVVYLNPYFRDPSIAQAIDDAVRSGYFVYAVGEGYAGRAGWRGADSSLADVVAAADVFISAAGMGALALARAANVPMIAIASDQPEQRANLASTDGGWRRVVDIAGDIRAQLVTALAEVPTGPRATDPELAVRRSRAQWLTTLRTLVERNLDRKA